jgi:predicted transcriptional regulator
MDNCLKEALEIVKAQASFRTMTEDEITGMVQNLTMNFQGMIGCAAEPKEEEQAAAPAMDPKKAVRERSVTCLECGKPFRVLTKRHIGQHGMSTEEYKEKYGYEKNAPLIAKNLARERRKKMQEMKLWEKRGAGKREKAAE